MYNTEYNIKQTYVMTHTTIHLSSSFLPIHLMASYDLTPKISALILDLDGTLLNTENASKGIIKELLAKHGKELDKERESKKRLGMTLQVSAAAIVKDYELPLTPDEFIREIMPMYYQKWLQANALPGANRLIKHLFKHGIPFALASNSSTDSVNTKISRQEGWKDCFSVIMGSDQVKSGKPSPDLFLEAARRMGVNAEECLVIEDSMVGVKAAKAAKMKAVAVPSLSEADCSLLADSVLHSLLEFHPHLWGLPPFDDWTNNALRIEPIYWIGKYKNGSLLEVTNDSQLPLPHQVSGIYFGWAKVDIRRILKVVFGFGRDLSVLASDRSIKICVIDGRSDELAAAEELQLALVGYIRGLNNEKETLNGDVEITEADRSIASASLDLPTFLHHFASPACL